MRVRLAYRNAVSLPQESCSEALWMRSCSKQAFCRMECCRPAQCRLICRVCFHLAVR